MVDLPRCSPFKSPTKKVVIEPTEAMLFMDHRGSLFHEDLQNFQEFDETKLELIC